MTIRSRAALALVSALVLLAAACGDDDGDTETGGTDTSTETSEASSSTMGDEGGDSSGDAVLAVAETDLGEVLVDADGRTLYIFTNDTEGTPTCEGQCADNWPAALVDGEPVADDAVSGEVGTVEALAGGQQLTIEGQPLYLFAGDSAPGDVNGQGVGGVWFAVAPDGTPVGEDGAAMSDSSSTTAASSDYGGY